MKKYRAILFLLFTVTAASFFALSDAHADTLIDRNWVEMMGTARCLPTGHTQVTPGCEEDYKACKVAFETVMDNLFSAYCTGINPELCSREGSFMYKFSNSGMHKVQERLDMFHFLEPAVKDTLSCPSEQRVIGKIFRPATEFIGEGNRVTPIFVKPDVVIDPIIVTKPDPAPENTVPVQPDPVVPAPVEVPAVPAPTEPEVPVEAPSQNQEIPAAPAPEMKSEVQEELKNFDSVIAADSRDDAVPAHTVSMMGGCTLGTTVAHSSPMFNVMLWAIILGATGLLRKIRF